MGMCKMFTAISVHRSLTPNVMVYFLTLKSCSKQLLFLDAFFIVFINIIFLHRQTLRYAPSILKLQVSSVSHFLIGKTFSRLKFNIFSPLHQNSEKFVLSVIPIIPCLSSFPCDFFFALSLFLDVPVNNEDRPVYQEGNILFWTGSYKAFKNGYCSTKVFNTCITFLVTNEAFFSSLWLQRKNYYG